MLRKKLKKNSELFWTLQNSSEQFRTLVHGLSVDPVRSKILMWTPSVIPGYATDYSWLRNCYSWLRNCYSWLHNCYFWLRNCFSSLNSCKCSGLDNFTSLETFTNRTRSPELLNVRQVVSVIQKNCSCKQFGINVTLQNKKQPQNKKQSAI